jgi:hypothetical protein
MDADAVVRLGGGTARASWSAAGWFGFEGVGLQSAETQLMLMAERVGLPVYSCTFTVRSILPRKSITVPVFYPIRKLCHCG